MGDFFKAMSSHLRVEEQPLMSKIVEMSYFHAFRLNMTPKLMAKTSLGEKISGLPGLVQFHGGRY